ncbi:MAG: Gfo/Idh/MocA family oxidoreductase, partial [Candidatus Dormibacteraceae bacterium]
MTEPIPVLVVGSRPPRSLARRLGEPGLFDLDLAAAPPADLGRHRVILAAGPQRPLGPEAAAALGRFVNDGGGLVTLGPALAEWAAEPAFRELAGCAPAELSSVTELIVSPVPGHAVTRRLDPELRFTDRVHLDLVPPVGATVLFNLSWRFSERPIGFTRPVGSGRHVHLELGALADSMASEALRQIVHRLVRHAAGSAPASVTGVGMLGYGAIGREHAEAIQAVEGLELRVICDRSPGRRDGARSEFGVKTCEEARDLLADPGVDLVVVGVPPSAHAEAVLEALAAGRHVVCEKPFALTSGETDRMMGAAAAADRVLTVYQSRRWDPDFTALRAAVESGEVGEPFYMESFIGGYSHPCGYWHSDEGVSGGTISD